MRHTVAHVRLFAAWRLPDDELTKGGYAGGHPRDWRRGHRV